MPEFCASHSIEITDENTGKSDLIDEVNEIRHSCPYECSGACISPEKSAEIKASHWESGEATCNIESALSSDTVTGNDRFSERIIIAPTEELPPDPVIDEIIQTTYSMNIDRDAPRQRNRGRSTRANMIPAVFNEESVSDLRYISRPTSGNSSIMVRQLLRSIIRRRLNSHTSRTRRAATIDRVRRLALLSSGEDTPGIERTVVYRNLNRLLDVDANEVSEIRTIDNRLFTPFLSLVREGGFYSQEVDNIELPSDNYIVHLSLCRPKLKDYVNEALVCVNRALHCPIENHREGISDAPFMNGPIHLSSTGIYRTALDLLTNDNDNMYRVLNIGCGTGYLSRVFRIIQNRFKRSLRKEHYQSHGNDKDINCSDTLYKLKRQCSWQNHVNGFTNEGLDCRLDEIQELLSKSPRFVRECSSPYTMAPRNASFFDIDLFRSTETFTHIYVGAAINPDTLEDMASTLLEVGGVIVTPLILNTHDEMSLGEENPQGSGESGIHTIEIEQSEAHSETIEHSTPVRQIPRTPGTPSTVASDERMYPSIQMEIPDLGTSRSLENSILTSLSQNQLRDIFSSGQALVKLVKRSHYTAELSIHGAAVFAELAAEGSWPRWTPMRDIDNITSSDSEQEILHGEPMTPPNTPEETLDDQNWFQEDGMHEEVSFIEGDTYNASSSILDIDNFRDDVLNNPILQPLSPRGSVCDISVDEMGDAMRGSRRFSKIDKREKTMIYKNGLIWPTCSIPGVKKEMIFPPNYIQSAEMLTQCLDAHLSQGVFMASEILKFCPFWWFGRNKLSITCLDNSMVKCKK